MTQLKLFPSAEEPKNFQAEEPPLPDDFHFPKVIQVKVAAGVARAATYKDSVLWQAIKAEYPNLIVSVAADKTFLQLRAGVYAIYKVDSVTAQNLMRNVQFGPSDEHWTNLTLEKEVIKL